jgi:hypothetical protein
VSLRIAAHDDDIDVYLVHRGFEPEPVFVKYGYHLADVGRGLRFYFYTSERKCITCEDRDQLTGGELPRSGIQVSWQDIAIGPNEIVGRSVPMEMVSAIYNLPNGCYGLYAVANGEFSVRGVSKSPTLVSNSTTVCVNVNTR